MQDPHVISSVDQLREVIAAPSPVAGRKVASALDENARQFIADSPFVFVSTADRHFNLDVSPKGDAPGFVRVEDTTTLLIPDRSGNRLTYGFQNILDTGAIGLIFLIPGVRETLRINGAAVLTRDPALLRSFAVEGKPALLCTRVTVRESFFHCAKALIRSKLWQPDQWRATASRDCAVKQWATSFGINEADVRQRLEEDYRCNL